jgi:hypothetical protein
MALSKDMSEEEILDEFFQPKKFTPQGTQETIKGNTKMKLKIKSSKVYS